MGSSWAKHRVAPARWLEAAWEQGKTCRASIPILGLYTCRRSQGSQLHSHARACLLSFQLSSGHKLIRRSTARTQQC